MDTSQASAEGYGARIERDAEPASQPHCVTCSRPMWSPSLISEIRGALREAGYLMPDSDVEIIANRLATLLSIETSA